MEYRDKMELTKSKRNAMLAVMMVGAFLSSMSQSLLTSALASIMDFFHITASTAQLLTTGYILVLGVVSATTAYLINKYKTQKLFIWAIAIFLFGNLLACFATDFYILLIARIIQAFGGGILLPQIQVVALKVYPKEKRGSVMGLVGLVVAFAPAIGPTLSGVLVDSLGWRSIFWFLAAISAVILVCGMFFVKNIGENYTEKLDWLSVALYTVGFCGLMIGVTNYSEYGFAILQTIIPIAVGLICLACFSLRQFRIENPLLELRVFKDRNFTIMFILIMILYMSNMAGVTLVPLYIQTARGFSATISGLVLLPAALINIVLNPVMGKLFDEYGPRRITLVGMALLVAGNSAFILFKDNISMVIVAVAYCFRIAGATIIMPLTAYGVEDLNKKMISHGMALVSSVRQMAGSLGTAILVAIVTLNSTHSSVDVHGINLSFSVQSVIYSIMLVYAFVLIRGGDSVKSARS